MRVTENQIGVVSIITLSGRLGGWRAASDLDDCFRRQARSIKARTVIVDLGDVPAVDTAGVDALIRAAQLMRYAGAEMRIVGLTRRIRDLVVITRLAMLCDAFETVAEAMHGPVHVPEDMVDTVAQPAVYTVHA
jgi:anti-sigma B factor antagonist